MKSLQHNFQNAQDLGCFVYQNNLENKDPLDLVVDKETAEGNNNFQEDSPDEKEKSLNGVDVMKGRESFQDQIQSVLDAFGGQNEQDLDFAKKLLKDIPASEFLKLKDLKKLRKLFLTGKEGGEERTVDLHGNEEVRQYIGLGDLFPREQGFVKINGVVGKRSISKLRGKVGYLDKSGRYFPIYGGEEIDLNVSESEQQGFEKVKTYSEEEEKETTDAFKEKIEAQEKAKEEMRASMRKLLQDEGLSDEEIENMSSKELFKKVAVFLAHQVEDNYGIPWKVCLAQTALETKGGKVVRENSFFGIKAMKGYLGKSQEFLTTEYWTGDENDPSKLVDKFRAYDSISDSFNDYGRLIRNLPRYAGAFEHKHSPKKFLETVIASGYATDPNYVTKAENALGELGYSLGNGYDTL